MIFIPIALAAISAVLFFIGRGQGKKALDMASTETTMAAELSNLAAQVGREIGAGSFTRPAELKGEVECAQPLRAEMSGAACAWYRSTVTREYEETYTERDSEGRSRTATRRGSETVSSNERRTAFLVRDPSGSMEVDPEGAAVDGERVLSRFEQGEPGPSLTIGGFSVSLGRIGQGRRTIGYKLEEWALPVGRTVYVLGEARDDGGRLRVAKPGAKGGRFIISLKSEEQLLKAARTGARVLSIVAAVLMAGAAVLLALVVLGVI